MLDQDVPSRGVEVNEQHDEVPWPEMVLCQGDPKPKRADYAD